MKNFKITFLLISIMILSGCRPFRLPATEKMKKNAWLHCRTTELAADLAKSENSSSRLQNITELSAMQSLAFVSDAGLPKDLSGGGTVEEILSQENIDLAGQAIADTQKKIDLWTAADGLMDFGIAVAALFGGAGAVKLVSGLKTVKHKSRALKEIIEGNELFKQLNPDAAKPFKSAHNRQSRPTKTLVARLK